MTDLSVIADGKLMGRIFPYQGRHRFLYAEGWREFPQAFPLSLSMPLVVAEHAPPEIEAYVWGLLPDNDGILNQWGKRFQVSPRNPFKLIEKVGEDCAGAVQFVPSDREETLLENSPVIQVSWLSQSDLDGRIRLLLEDHSATRASGDHGQFSLAGAQPKIALYHDPDRDRWGISEGRTPTTHILKPATGSFDGHVENEHFCLRLAAALGLRTAVSKIMEFGGYPVIVIERHDRLRLNDRVARVHQEDFCQALAIPPQIKYQNQGGPSAKAVADVIRVHSTAASQDILRFADALIFNWLISGTDAHGKNYSLLLAAGSQVRLAPLYDLASSLPYPRQVDPHKAKLAMRIGSNYKIREIGRSNWESCARELRLTSRELLGRIENLADRLPGMALKVADELHREGILHRIVESLPEMIRLHISTCRERLAGR